MKKYTLALSVTVLLCLGLHLPTLADEVTEASTDTSMFSFSGDAHLGTFTSKSDSESDVAGSLRLQLQLEPVEDITLTGRVALSKIFDSDRADNDYWEIDRFFFTWATIADTSFSVLAGRLPSREGGSAFLREGLNTPQGLLSSYTNTVVDGAMLSYKYEGLLPGSIRLFYGRQFDIGYEESDVVALDFEDTDLYGINWELFSKDSHLVTLEAFVFDNIYNTPEDLTFPNPYELALINFGIDPTVYGMNANGILDRQNMGDIYVTSLSYLDKLGALNFFINGAWSHTDPTDVDEIGISLLSDSWNEPEERDGYSIYTGLRYDMEELHSKIGLEYNYGSKYWIGPGSKLATRGSVIEGYFIFNPALPPPVSTYLDNFLVRVGYQHYWYDYTYSGMWLGKPMKIDDAADDPVIAQFYDTEDEEYILYLSLALYF